MAAAYVNMILEKEETLKQLFDAQKKLEKEFKSIYTSLIFTTVAILCNIAVMFFYFSLPLLSYIDFLFAITDFLFFLKIVRFFESAILLKDTFAFKHFIFSHSSSKQFESSYQIFFCSRKRGRLFSNI